MRLICPSIITKDDAESDPDSDTDADPGGPSRLLSEANGLPESAESSRVTRLEAVDLVEIKRT